MNRILLTGGTDRINALVTELLSRAGFRICEGVEDRFGQSDEGYDAEDNLQAPESGTTIHEVSGGSRAVGSPPFDTAIHAVGDAEQVERYVSGYPERYAVIILTCGLIGDIAERLPLSGAGLETILRDRTDELRVLNRTVQDTHSASLIVHVTDLFSDCRPFLHEVGKMSGAKSASLNVASAENALVRDYAAIDPLACELVKAGWVECCPEARRDLEHEYRRLDEYFDGEATLLEDVYAREPLDGAIDRYRKLLHEAEASERRQADQPRPGSQINMDAVTDLLEALNERQQRGEQLARAVNAMERSLGRAHHEVETQKDGAADLLAELRDSQNRAQAYAETLVKQGRALDRARRQGGADREAATAVLEDLARARQESQCLARQVNRKADAERRKSSSLRGRRDLVFDNAEVTSVVANPDYSNVCLRLVAPKVLGRSCAEWTVRLACANVHTHPFGTYPKIEVPAQDCQLLEGWYCESSDEHGQRWELRFKIPHEVDVSVLRNLGRKDFLRLQAFLRRVPDILMQAAAGEGGTPYGWHAWVDMAESMEALLAREGGVKNA